MSDLADFQTAALACLLWQAMVPDPDDSEGNPLPADDLYDMGDFDPESRDAFLAECSDFFAHHRRTIRWGGITPEQAGHDFVLTRNHHGAGFWDRSYNPAQTLYHAGRVLTDACRAYGPSEVIASDDGALYIY